MKRNSRANPPSIPSNGARWLALAAGFALSAGCGKKPAADVPPGSEVAAPPAPAGQPVTNLSAAPAVIPTDPGGGVDLRALNHAYIGWIVQNRRRPRTYEEFITLSGTQVPRPPSGKKYVIDRNGFIALADE